MKIKITTPVVNYKGENIKVTDNGKLTDTNFTFQDLCYRAVSEPFEGEKMTGETRQQCHQLSIKLFSNDVIDITHTQIGFIMDRVEKVFFNSPMFCGKAKEFFDNEKKGSKEPEVKE